MKLSNQVYDFMKWFTLLFLPALTTFVGVILKCFDIACTDTVLTIMSGLITFLATILGISNMNYKRRSDNA